MNVKVSSYRQFNYSKLCCLLVLRQDVVKSSTKFETLTNTDLTDLNTKSSG